MAMAGACMALVGGASVLASCGSGTGRSSVRQAPAVRAGGNWTRFGYDAARHNAGPGRTGITATNVGSLRRQRVSIPGTADSSPIYLRGVRVKGAGHDVFILPTSYGRAVAVDADTGRRIWSFTPRAYASWAGSYRITHSSPVVSADRRFVYSASPGGQIHKISIATGREVRTGWPATITRNPGREKIGPALNLAHGLVLAATGGYIGDAPPYQGHVVALDATTGRIRQVWNALCSDRRLLIVPASCSESGAAIWARSGVVVVPGSGRLLVATGDGHWDGRTHWGDSVLLLSRDAGRLLQNWTPTDQANLDSGDVDLGSTAPALLSSRYAVQGGKDAKLRLLDLRRLNGRGGAGPVTGGQVQTVQAPGGAGVFAAPAVWRNKGRAWLFATTDSGTAAFTLEGGRLRPQWRNGTGGTSPVVAGGLLYIYDQGNGRLNVYVPTTGRRLAALPAESGHWSSPIVTDGRIALPTGDANEHRTSGVLDIYRLPG
jgi:outer membrane protein assembly factor BamB